MADLFWFIFLGLIALIGVVVFLMRDAAKSTAAASVNDANPAAELNDGQAIVEPTAAGSGWQTGGLILIVIGAIGFVIGLFLDTSVQVYGAGLIGSPSEVVNLELLFRKGATIACSLTALSLGLFCLAVGAVIRVISIPKV